VFKNLCENAFSNLEKPFLIAKCEIPKNRPKFFEQNRRVGDQ
jgi:hypothetical protein